MQPFTTLTGVAAPLPMINVDTDMIIPARHLKTIKRTGLGTALFESMRYGPDGAERPDFVLNRERYRAAQILIAGDNFGCGSSREHAPWALEDYGFKAIVAPSFADIFKNNCTKNGLLPIELPAEQCRAIAERGRARIDLEAQTVDEFAFDIDPEIKHRLLNGLDDISLTLQQEDAIAAFERDRERPGPVTTAL